MTASTSPTVSEAMREGILHDEVQALIAVAKQKVAERDARIAALEQESATLRAERDGLRMACLAVRKSISRFPGSVHDRAMAKIDKALGRTPSDFIDPAEAELATLRASAERMEATLKPFAKAADIVDEDATENWLPPHDDDCRIDPILPSGEAPFLAFVGDLRRARAALTPKETPDA